MIELAVIIVNYKTPELVVNCLDSLLPEMAHFSSRVIVVDNHSRDGSCDIIQQWMTDHASRLDSQLIRSQKNTGFSGGNNLGIRACEARHYLLLNSDTLVRPGAIKLLVDTAQAMPEVGLIGPRIEGPNGEGQSSCFKRHSIWGEFAAAAQTGVIDRLLARYVVALPPQDQSMFPEWISFACILIKGEVFKEVGLLDEGYFMYFEDAEFCDRATRAQWKIFHLPSATIMHYHSGSSGIGKLEQQKRRLPHYYYASRSRYFYQLFGRGGLLLVNLMWMAGRSISLTRQLFGRSDKAVNKWMWRDIWINFSKCE